MVRSSMTTEEKAEIWRRYRGGASLRSIHQALGRSGKTVWDFVASTGGIPPVERARFRCDSRWPSGKRSPGGLWPTSRAGRLRGASVAPRPRSHGRLPGTAAEHATGRAPLTAPRGNMLAGRSRRSSPRTESWARSKRLNSSSAGRPSRSRAGSVVSIPLTRSSRCHTRRSTRRCLCSRGAR